jgi:hypothetical protein
MHHSHPQPTTPLRIHNQSTRTQTVIYGRPDQGCRNGPPLRVNPDPNPSNGQPLKPGAGAHLNITTVRTCPSATCSLAGHASCAAARVCTHVVLKATSTEPQQCRLSHEAIGALSHASTDVPCQQPGTTATPHCLVSRSQLTGACQTSQLQTTAGTACLSPIHHW